MADFRRRQLAWMISCSIRDTDLDDEYNLGGGGIPTPTLPAPTRKVWQPGILVQPGEIYEAVTDNGFQFKAIQAAAAYTGSAEPNWPLVNGNTVVDGGVTWEAIAKTSITWQAIPLYKSGAVEPAWPVLPGGTVVDNGITWTASVPYIDDPYCPPTKVALVIASKVFKPNVNGDVVRYCATNDATDWTSADDAGFLPTGLQATTEINCTLLAEYRGNLVVMTPSDFMAWQVDPDPAQMTHLDTIQGIGTIYPRAAASIASDLMILTPQGVRSVGVAAASTNLQDSDVGKPVDDLIRQELAAFDDPTAFYNASLGEFWVVFGSKAYVYQKSRLAKVEAWSRDEYPFPIDANTSLGGALYLRSGNKVYKVNRDRLNDAGAYFDSLVWWPHLDMGAPGASKMLVGVDIVASGTVTLSVGYDQTNGAAYTAPHTIGPDTVPGTIVPIPACAPSFAPKLEWKGADNQGAKWKLDALSFYLNDLRSTA